MTRGKSYPADFKARVVIETLREEKTVAQVASEHGLAPKLVSRWRTELLQNADRAFSADADADARERELAEHRREVDEPRRIIGRLTAERDYPRRGLRERLGIDLGGPPGSPICRAARSPGFPTRSGPAT